MVGFTGLGLWLLSAAANDRAAVRPRRPLVPALLYLALVLIAVVVLWVQERRERRRDPDAEVDRRDLDLE